MRERRQTVMTRDPQPETRDPDTAMRLSVPCVPEGRTLCPQCGHGVSRVCNTKRYDEFTPRVVIRYRDCLHCGFHFASRAVL